MKRKPTQKTTGLILSLVLLLALLVPAQAAGPFADVSPDAWYAAGVADLAEKGIMIGTGEDAFSPDAAFTRAQMATVLYRLAGTPAVTGEDAFTDTRPGTWYADAVAWCAAEGIVEGYGHGLFGPADPVTQEQTAVMLWRDAGSYVIRNDDTDVLGASDYAVDGVRWAIVDGLISESGPAFQPREPASRGRVADMVSRYLVLLERFSSADAVSGATTDPEEAGTAGRAGETGKILVAYFSRAGENYNVGVVSEGNTARLAKEIAAQTGGDLFEIVPAVPYPASYDEALTVATAERKNDARPEISTTVTDFGQYDTVFLGYPIWWGDLPMILHTFMEGYDFTGKTVIPFNTHEGSGQSGTQSAVAEKLSGAKVLQGLAMRGSDAQKLAEPYGSDSTVKNWLDGLGVPLK